MAECEAYVMMWIEAETSGRLRVGGAVNTLAGVAGDNQEPSVLPGSVGAGSSQDVGGIQYLQRQAA